LQEASEDEEDVGRHRKNEKTAKADAKGKGKKKKRSGFIDDAAEEVGLCCRSPDIVCCCLCTSRGATWLGKDSSCRAAVHQASRLPLGAG
jgi:hypothetical protein